MKQVLCFLACICLGVGSICAQVVTKQILIVNGGKFSFTPGFPEDPANVQIYDPAQNTYRTLDTIGTTSVQDLIVSGTEAYLAAGDSIIRYDLVNETRLAAQIFGGESTVTLALTDQYLLVGNFFLPFNSTGPYPNNLRIFNRETLAVIDSIPELARPVKSIAIVGESAYVTQNFSNQSFADSAGFLVKIDLNTFDVLDTIQVNQNQEDLGPLVQVDSVLYGLNGASNTITALDLRTDMASTDTANAIISPGVYGSRFAFDEKGEFFLVINGQIGRYDLANRSVIEAGIVDTVITAFALDTLSDRFYVTQTDFFSFQGGIIYDRQGMRIDTLLTGFAPEVIAPVYNHLPIFADQAAETMENMAVSIALNGQDDDAISYEVITLPLNGQAQLSNDTLTYTPNTDFSGEDSLLVAAIDLWNDRDTAQLNIAVTPITKLPGGSLQLIKVYPIPARDYLNLAWDPNQWQGNIQVLNALGQVLFDQVAPQQGQLKLEVSHWPSGQYWVRGEGSVGTWQVAWRK